MNDTFIVTALSIVPKNRVASWMGRGARLQLPASLQGFIVRWFAKRYNVDMSECEGEVEDFPSLAEFFVRELKGGARPIDHSPDVLVSPADGKVHTMGRIENGQFMQAPEIPASVEQLIGVGELIDSDRYNSGHYIVIYLSPTDYHRVHTPVEGTVLTARYSAGSLWPVFAAATRKIGGLFGVNERLTFEIDTPFGKICEVLVGAFGVGRVTTHITDLKSNAGYTPKDVPVDHEIGRGDEIGRFELGSTAILLLEDVDIEWTVKVGEQTRLGRGIATIKK